jgi:hypothetical protein
MPSDPSLAPIRAEQEDIKMAAQGGGGGRGGLIGQKQRDPNRRSNFYRPSNGPVPYPARIHNNPVPNKKDARRDAITRRLNGGSR